ncbi:MAG: PAS domain-containing protein [Pelobacteraceae bacterium]
MTISTELEALDFLKATMDALSAHIVILDEAGMIVFANRAWKDFVKDAGEGGNYLEICEAACGQDSERAAATVAGVRAVISGLRDDYQLQYSWHGLGEKRWFNLKVTRVPGIGRTHVAVAHENITELKLAEELLGRRERELKSILDNMPAMIGYWDHDLRCVFGNSDYHRWFGIDPETMRGKHIREVIGDERYRLNLPYIEGALRGETQFFERAIPTPDGSDIRYSQASYIPDIQDGEVMGFFVLVTDVSRIKIAEQALREREQFLKLVIETEPECVKLLDRDGALLMMNRAGLNMIDAETFEMVKGHRMCELVNPEYREGFINLTRAAFEGNAGELVFEITGLKGRRLWLESHAVPLRNEQGTIISMIAITRDITIRKQALEALANKQQQLEMLNSSLEERISQAVAELRLKDRMMIQQSRQAAMGEMINNIAHQWRQPLNNLGLIQQNIEMSFNSGTLDEAELKTDLHSSMEIIKFMSRTIDDFRNFFRPDKQFQSFRLKDAVLLAQKFVSASLQHQGITVETDIDEGVYANGYPNEYAQVVLNILGNARDAFAANAIASPFIRIEGNIEDGAALLVVQDNGGGIDEGVIDRIFDPYFTTKGEDKGTGIGLYMSKVIIEKMAGRLTVRNIDGGAEFRVEIPARAATA